MRERGASTIWLGIWSRSLYSWVKLVSGLPRAIESSSVIQGLLGILGISGLDSVLVNFHFQCHGYVGWYYISSLYNTFFYLILCILVIILLWNKAGAGTAVSTKAALCHMGIKIFGYRSAHWNGFVPFLFSHCLLPFSSHVHRYLGNRLLK